MKIRKFLSLTLSMLLLSSTVVMADPIEQEVSYDKTQAENFLKNNNFSKEQEETLRKKIENNELLDCYKKENLEKIPDDFNNFDLSDGAHSKKYYFEDGSFIEISFAPASEDSEKIEITKDNIENFNMIDEPLATYDTSKLPISTFGVISDSYGTLYTNYRVSRTVGDQSAFFYGNFYLSRSGNSRIYVDGDGNGYNSPFGEEANGFGVGAFPEKVMIRAYEDRATSQGAIFRLKWLTTATVSGGWSHLSGSIPIGTTCNLYLALVRGQIYIDSSLPF